MIDTETPINLIILYIYVSIPSFLLNVEMMLHQTMKKVNIENF